MERDLRPSLPDPEAEERATYYTLGDTTRRTSVSEDGPRVGERIRSFNANGRVVWLVVQKIIGDYQNVFWVDATDTMDTPKNHVREYQAVFTETAPGEYGWVATPTVASDDTASSYQTPYARHAERLAAARSVPVDSAALYEALTAYREAAIVRYVALLNAENTAVGQPDADEWRRYYTLHTSLYRPAQQRFEQTFNRVVERAAQRRARQTEAGQ